MKQNLIKSVIKTGFSYWTNLISKGFDLLLQAWKIVETKINDWHLEIVCGYGDYHALEEEAHSMGIKT